MSAVNTPNCAATHDVGSAPVPPLDALQRRLLNDFQRGFPLAPAPFAIVAARLGVSEGTVLEQLHRLQAWGCVSRVGPVFRPHAAGASTLAAMAVPSGRLESVAGLVSGYEHVNHNYERDHRLNLWFVITAADAASLAAVRHDIEARTGLAVVDLPLLEDYYIDLGFDLDWDAQTARATPPASRRRAPPTPTPVCGAVACGEERELVAAIEAGFALVPRPYAAVGAALGVSEATVLQRLAALIERGVIRRLGVVVRHHELGYRANAMAVWDVPDADVGRLGRCLAGHEAVRLCYRRPRRPPAWRYNLFGMVHGRDRAAVEQEIARLADACGLARFPGEVLFSLRRFKQRGARYQGIAGARPAGGRGEGAAVAVQHP